uniref:F-box and WD repeat domain containing 8 n=1 Tax=Zonotrichia albicollis TaxID=44394 RepID=A0A8D2MMY4_ZONAL
TAGIYSAPKQNRSCGAAAPARGRDQEQAAAGLAAAPALRNFRSSGRFQHLMGAFLTNYFLLFPSQNEINEVPFFDVQLPYELALKIFQYLGKAELGRCAQVSRTWKILAEDEVLWYRLCQEEGYLLDMSISDHSCWKLALKNCRAREHMINSSLAVAAHEDGTVSVWSLLLGQEPIHHFQHNQHLQALALAPGGAAVATASGFQVRLESPDDRGFWQTPGTFEIQKLVNFLNLVPDVTGSPVAVAAAEDIVYLLKAEAPGRILHSVYGQPVTCLDVAAHEAAFGIKTFGWLLNEPNQILLYNLETNQCVTKLGNSMGAFSCVNLHSSPPNMLVAGNKDRRVRVFDLRCGEAVCCVQGHQLGVCSVQMDEWKVVSGGEEGLLCVWDQRMATKLWEMHARHPVRHVWFDSHILITANIPEEKNPRGDLLCPGCFARRYRGVIYSYDFSVDQLAVDSVLPICRSSYDEVSGYSYNIGLAVPYDSI